MNQGRQYIPDPGKAHIDKKFRGLPVVNNKNCSRCGICEEVCPTGAIGLAPLRIDLGKCVFCGDCERECPEKSIRFNSEHKFAFSSASADSGKEIKRIFGNSLKLRQVSAGGCNGCEMELAACSNANFDMGRYGIEFTASPRHADGIVITGPVSENMSAALDDTLKAVPEPRIIIAVGTCAISGGIFASSPALKRDFFDRNKIDLYIPGCPPHPLTFIDGILRLLKK